jgi:CRP-like cAMP-binding protein
MLIVGITRKGAVVRNARIATLANFKLFEHCSRRELRRIDGLATEVAVAPGRRLCEQGAIGMEFFVLLRGGVTVSLDDSVISHLDAGDWFGEIALTSPGCRRIATVATKLESRVLVFDRREYRALVDAAPCVEQVLAASATSRALSCLAWRGGALATA